MIKAMSTIERLAEKHGGTVIDYSLPEGPQATDTTVIIATSELAALIAYVCRQAMEEAGSTEVSIDPSDMINRHRRWHGEGVEALRGAIRARPDSPMEKEEGK